MSKVNTIWVFAIIYMVVAHVIAFCPAKADEHGCARIHLKCFQQEYEPPAEWNVEPNAAYRIKYLPYNELQEQCWNRVALGEWGFGCTKHGSNTILLDKELEGTPEGDIIFRHERAHIVALEHGIMWKH